MAARRKQEPKTKAGTGPPEASSSGPTRRPRKAPRRKETPVPAQEQDSVQEQGAAPPEAASAPADGTRRRVGRKDIGVANVFFLPRKTSAEFAALRRVGEPNEIYKTEAIDLIVGGQLDRLVEGLIALGVEALPPRKERKSIRLQVSQAADDALVRASDTTGLDKLHLLVAAIHLAAHESAAE